MEQCEAPQKTAVVCSARFCRAYNIDNHRSAHDTDPSSRDRSKSYCLFGRSESPARFFHSPPSPSPSIERTFPFSQEHEALTLFQVLLLLFLINHTQRRETEGLPLDFPQNELYREKQTNEKSYKHTNDKANSYQERKSRLKYESFKHL